MADILVPAAAWHTSHLRREQPPQGSSSGSQNAIFFHPVHLCQLLNKRVQVLLAVRPLNRSTTQFSTNPLRDELS